MTCPTCHGPRRADGSCPACLLGLARDPQATATLPAGVRPPPDLDDLRLRLPAFEILALHGRGGMGAVYRARQRDLGRLVALKIVVPHRPEVAERFAAEARALARLDHPGIVRVFDAGIAGDLCWLTMEFIDGPTLRGAMRAGDLPPARSLALIPELCAALQYAHDQGVVHRDIKPENLLLTPEGRLKIADFGLARLLGDPALGATRTGVVMGTANYMAPEQIERPGTVDHRADLFALGVVFYELLTGELPLGRFAAPSQKAAIDARLDEVVFRALEKEPARHWQQAGHIQSRMAGIAARPGRTQSDEFRTATTWQGWPLIHLVRGTDPATGKPRIARGVIAIGPRAVGGLAIGGRAKGLIAVGGLATGIIAIGGLAVGGLAVGGLTVGLGFAVGGLALGTVAAGGLAVGLGFAVGGLALGTVAAGGLAMGWVGLGTETVAAHAGALNQYGVFDPLARVAFDEILHGATTWWSLGLLIAGLLALGPVLLHWFPSRFGPATGDEPPRINRTTAVLGVTVLLVPLLTLVLLPLLRSPVTEDQARSLAYDISHLMIAGTVPDGDVRLGSRRFPVSRTSLETLITGSVAQIGPWVAPKSPQVCRESNGIRMVMLPLVAQRGEASLMLGLTDAGRITELSVNCLGIGNPILAGDLLAALRDRRWDDVRQPCTLRLRAALTNAVLAEVWDGFLACYGDVEGHGEAFRIQVKAGEADQFHLPIRFTRGKATLRLVFAAEGRVAGLWLDASPLAADQAERLAKAVADDLAGRRFAAVVAREAPAVREALGEPVLRRVWDQVAPEQTIVPGPPKAQPRVDGMTTVLVTLAGGAAPFRLTVTLDDLGRVIGLLIQPGA